MAEQMYFVAEFMIVQKALMKYLNSLTLNVVKNPMRSETGDIYNCKLDDKELSFRVFFNDELVRNAVAEHVENSIEFFTAEFLQRHVAGGKLPIEAIEAIQAHKDANEIFTKMVDNMDDFVQDAIDADGTGHFLATYDGKEIVYTRDEDEDIFAGTTSYEQVYMYRLD